jgi:hypothetical protein
MLTQRAQPWAPALPPASRSSAAAPHAFFLELAASASPLQWPWRLVEQQKWEEERNENWEGRSYDLCFAYHHHHCAHK